MEMDIQALTQGLNKTRGAGDEEIAQLKASFDYELPEDYVGFLKHTNGAYGLYVDFWNIEEVITTNRELVINELGISDLFLFGSDMANETFAFDFRGERLKIIQIPLICMVWEDAIHLADSFKEFLEKLKENPELYPL